ncbi:MAG TPA: preprotein translocase subunit SecG [Burkholderiales bacterium]|nr:preprotein translocase subunit SecG [Burkholderiales bacterium]
MDWMNLVIVLHVLIALGIIGLVLLQHGKGADMGSGFGGGASGSLFGATGSANFLSRATALLATLFFVTSLGLAYLATNKPRAGGGVLDAVKAHQSAPAPEKAAEKPATEAPKAPAAAPAEAPPAGSKPKDVPQ